ncbi:relaxase/mobilization nuclease domain-containing protein [Ferruginibacter paludis]|uniref:relaxase/mobilization nuclease domain-containing protein n=1 Tax=Ferruginibacter paludis TaxID=1310417 RepID=UPI0025B2DE45|nr:relaxase/mobilization nuclease domain-containing protein [Ferruginibacter paludis]MDN3656060.1 relaxase/mobilization nuclease domain-containing protein [Ferruginibacter paludis]
MIGTVTTGSSFYHCISYCLEDKQKLTADEKIKNELTEDLQHKNRAEVLAYNYCFGNKQELADQFHEVARLSKRVQQPVLHLSLRLAPGEKLDREQLVAMGKTLAETFGVGDHQYLTILHKDTREQHIHLVANRVGYDGKAVSTSNNYFEMDQLCRRLEKEYHLREVLSARRFLSQEQRQIPRHDIRKEQLRHDLQQTLQKVNDYEAFHKQMQQLGYKIIKGRGICFLDDKKVKIKGSEVGYSLATIERILAIKRQLQEKQLQKIATALQPKQQKQAIHLSRDRQKIQRSIHPTSNMKDWENAVEKEINRSIGQLQKTLNHLLYDLTKPEPMQESISPELLKESERLKKKQRHLHL